ncbi:phenylalanyl-tRNA synthetase alpha chain [Nematocida sp. AWRm77]|nr:phenylalanyl-tRNA synthetase alpha chain [Nematocida sp. AWRm77]
MQSRDIEKEVLDGLKNKEPVQSVDIQAEYNTVIGAIKKLESLEQILCEPVQHEDTVLTEEGREIIENGSPEFILYSLVGEGVKLSELESKIKASPLFKDKTEAEIKGAAMKGRNNGISTGILKIDGGCLVRAVPSAEDSVQTMLKQVGTLQHTSEHAAALKKRKLVQQRKVTHYLIRKGPEYGNEEAGIRDITADMLGNLSLTANMKKYNFSIVSKPSKYSGALHPLSLEREAVADIFLQMGFEEMNAGKYVESSFWNFDALFQPQRHPARNEQDTFFLEYPEHAQDPPQEYLDRVRTVHTEGMYGSIGHQAPWSLEESRKNVLRTHTTAVTTRLLHSIAQSREEGKFFSIDRVFRNESLDATHLAEFHQVEGIVIGKGFTLSHMMGLLEVFFRKLGIEKIKFKPAYNPYTEPSMEVFAYHEEMKKWMEIGNSGIFRPEMLLPMGFAEDIRVLGWGISLERPVMISRNINNIRDLVGHKVDVSFVRNGLFKESSN